MCKRIKIRFLIWFYVNFIRENFQIRRSKGSTENENLYLNWRSVQREQLGLSANLYMLFASALLGFVTNFLVANRDNIGYWSIRLFSFGMFLLVLSLIFHGCFTNNRLIDFRRTAQFHSKGLAKFTVKRLTRKLGETTWFLYKCQQTSLTLGFVFSAMGFCCYIYS